jgi:hypothetical protein
MHTTWPDIDMSCLLCHACNQVLFFVMYAMTIPSILSCLIWICHDWNTQLRLFCHVWDYICHVCNKLLSNISCLQWISVQMVMSATKFRLLSCLQFTDLSCFFSRIMKFNQHTLTYLQECILHFNFIHWIASCWLFYRSYKTLKSTITNYFEVVWKSWQYFQSIMTYMLFS